MTDGSSGGGPEGTRYRASIGLFGLTGCGGDRRVVMGCHGALDRIVDIVDPDSFLAAAPSGGEARRLDIALVEGAVLTEEDEATILAIRAASDRVIALGTCALHGGVPVGSTYDTAAARPLDAVVSVDGGIAGCAIEEDELMEAMGSLLNGDPPLPRPYPVCTECKVQEHPCVLTERDGFCLGPITAAGCRATCPGFGVGCIGCRGAAVDANWPSALALFRERGVGRDAIVRKMRTFVRRSVGLSVLPREPDAVDAGPAPIGDSRISGLVTGRGWEDVAPIASRLSGDWSVAHTLTSILTTEAAFGVEVSERTRLLRELMWRGASIESHALELLGPEAPAWLGIERAETEAGIRLIRLGRSLIADVGGRATHPVNALPGGFGREPAESTLLQMQKRLEAARADADAALERVRRWPAPPPSDPLRLVALRLNDRYRYDSGRALIILGADGLRHSVPVAAWHEVPRTGRCVVGPLARLTINRDHAGAWTRSLLEDLGVAPHSGDPANIARARAIELATDVRRALEAVASLLESGTARGRAPVRPRSATAAVATETPDGWLLHSYTYDATGRIVRAHTMTPVKALTRGEIPHTGRGRL